MVGESHPIEYEIINPKLANRRRTVNVEFAREDVAHLVEHGFLITDNLFSSAQLDEMSAALDRIAAAEARHCDVNNPDLSSRAQYLRWLMDKDVAFRHLFENEPLRSMARAVLGPQVHFENADGRLCPADVAQQCVPWHVHLRCVPKPLPPFFCYPHALHISLYLDDVTDDSGALVVLPGSHVATALDLSSHDVRDLPGQLALAPRGGSCVLMHANLWHKTQPSTPRAGARRLILFSYCPAWLRSDQRGGIPPTQSFAAMRLVNENDPEMRELLGEFWWC